MPRVKLKHTDTHRTCYLCKIFLPVSQFTRRSTGTYFSACKECNKHVFGQRRRARIQGAEGEFSKREWDDLVKKHEVCPIVQKSMEKYSIAKGQENCYYGRPHHPNIQRWFKLYQ